MPFLELTIYQALVIGKEPDHILRGALYKEVYNILLQCAIVLSHGEWLQFAALEVLNRLLDTFKVQMFKLELDVDTLTEWGQMATDAKDIILEGAHDINDMGRSAFQTTSVMQLNTVDAYLAKMTYAWPMSVKGNLRQVLLDGPTLFSDGTVTLAIEVKVIADNVEFQKRVLSGKRSFLSNTQGKSQYHDRWTRKDRAEGYCDQEKWMG